MIAMVKITSGEEAWRYFDSTIASETGKANDYYTAEGTPPGRWYGGGLTGLGIRSGEVVTPSQLANLYGSGSHPLTGIQLAKSFTVAPTLEERVAAAIAKLPTTLGESEREEAIERIVVAETAHTPRGSVAGFEIVFNPPKSVSVWWALADESVKVQIRAAHEEAMRDTITILERDALRTRTGTDGVAQAEVSGIVATAFEHWDSRDSDPQLHTHLLVANRVQGVDGKWRTIDSRYALSPHIVTLSETYTATLMDGLSRRLGVEWVEAESMNADTDYRAFIQLEGLTDSQQSRALFATSRGVEAKNQKWEIRGLDEALLDEFSQRRKAITASKDRLIETYRERYGKDPDRFTIWRMRQAATRSTRKAKHLHSLSELTSMWRERASRISTDPTSMMQGIAESGKERLGNVRQWAVRADDFSGPMVRTVTEATLQSLSRSRSTWTRANALAEIQRLLKPVTFLSLQDRDAISYRVLGEVLTDAVPLTPSKIRHAPAQFRQSDGSSQFQPPSRELFTTQTIVSAENRLLAGSDTLTGLVVNGDTVAALLSTQGSRLGEDQRLAVQSICSSGRAVDLLVGPAGAGKTTTLSKLRDIWETQYGAGSVIGLAPSAVAAQVLGGALGIETENTAMWLARSQTGTNPAFTMKPGQLVIVDEAGMSGTLALDALRSQAANAGAKLLLVGDWAQLGAVDAGGAFELLATMRQDVPELVDVWRFSTGTNPWQAETSGLLRVGLSAGLTPYDRRGWIHSGDGADMQADALEAWRRDTDQGLNSLLIAGQNDVVDNLNFHAQQWLIQNGRLGAGAVPIRGGVAHEGDVIVTRENDRSLRASDGEWVRNGQTWTVLRVRQTGEAIVVSGDGAELTLSADYLREHVDLGYASTVHRSQGRTVDTTHTLVDEFMTREAFYVAVTRGRESNQLYVNAGVQGDSEHENQMTFGYMDALEQVLARTGNATSAMATAHEEFERNHNIRQLVAEYETIAATVNHARYGHLLAEALPDRLLDSVCDSASYDAIIRLLARADSRGLDLPEAIPQAVDERELTSAVDVGSVLHYRLSRHLTELMESTPDSGKEQRLIVGLIPVTDSENDDVQHALVEREIEIQHRATELVTQAKRTGDPWLVELGYHKPEDSDKWHQAAKTVAAYRDRWGVTDDAPLGRVDDLNHQRRVDYEKASKALQYAKELGGLAVSREVIEAQQVEFLTTVLPAATVERLQGAPGFPALANTMYRAGQAQFDLLGFFNTPPNLETGNLRNPAAEVNYRLNQAMAADLENRLHRRPGVSPVTGDSAPSPEIPGESTTRDGGVARK